MQVPTIPTVHVQEAARRVNGALIRYGHIIPVICFLACIGVSTVVTVQRQLVFTPFVFNFTIPATTTTTVAPSFTSTLSPNATATVPPLSSTTIAPSTTTTQAPSTSTIPAPGSSSGSSSATGGTTPFDNTAS